MESKYYLIKEKLEKTTKEGALANATPFVAILGNEAWENERESFSMGIDMEVRPESDTTKVEVNYDSLTGNFSFPKRDNISSGECFEFAFALDEKGIVFIDESGYVEKAVKKIMQNKKWKLPSLERFIYDFLENSVSEDLRLLESYEKQLDSIERKVLAGDTDHIMESLNDIRGDMLDLKAHYEQLIDLSQELEENENTFFEAQNLRYFRLFTNRAERYAGRVLALKEYSAQIRDLYQTSVDIKQNKIMAVLTVITTIFFPLSIITGWYGMNFEYMPELSVEMAYPILAIICFLIIMIEIIVFKKKKWL